MVAAATMAAVVIFFVFSAGLSAAAAAVVEHTFVVSRVNMTRSCKEILVTVVNGQLPGPTIEVTEGVSVAVHVVNNSTSLGRKAPCGGTLMSAPSEQACTAPLSSGRDMGRAHIHSQSLIGRSPS
nr:unnamed protein product [Digitaria exilis]